MLSIAHIGEAAHAVLDADGQGVVESVFERCAYIQINRSHVCVALPVIGHGPLNMLYDASVTRLPEPLKPTAPVYYSHNNKTLSIDKQSIAELVHACVSDCSCKAIDPFTGAGNALRDRIGNMQGPAAGLFGVVMAMGEQSISKQCTAAINSPANSGAHVEQALFRFSAPILQALASWLSASMLSGPAIPLPDKRIGRLIGAGPGLTPSGDDLLAGVLLSLRSSGHARVADALWAQLRPEVASRTNHISAAMLQQAALGKAGEFALGALALHNSLDEFDEKALSRMLGRMGESSGWDFLAGVVLVSDALATSLTYGKKFHG